MSMSETQRRAQAEPVEPIAQRPHLPKDYGVPATIEGVLAWGHARERLERARNYWIATVRPDRRPHAVPLWGVWVDETLYFDGSPKTRRGRNIAANPAVAVHLESGDDVVIVEGVAEEVATPDPSLAARIAAAYGGKYAPDYQPKPDQWDGGGLYAVRPRVAFAWTHFPQDMTRFVFDEA